MGLFTGWEDVPLAEEGVQEAKEAGRLLREYGFEFDVVYVSWLSRAIDTALYVLDEMGTLWLPVIKSWRLNERMVSGSDSYLKILCVYRRGLSSGMHPSPLSVSLLLIAVWFFDRPQ